MLIFAGASEPRKRKSSITKFRDLHAPALNILTEFGTTIPKILTGRPNMVVIL